MPAGSLPSLCGVVGTDRRRQSSTEATSRGVIRAVADDAVELVVTPPELERLASELETVADELAETQARLGAARGEVRGPATEATAQLVDQTWARLGEQTSAQARALDELAATARAGAAEYRDTDQQGLWAPR